MVKVLFAIPRSGSTFILQVAKMLLGDVATSHHHKDAPEIAPQHAIDPSIIVIRNFLDCAISYYRVHNDRGSFGGRPHDFKIENAQQLKIVYRLFSPWCDQLIAYAGDLDNKLVFNYSTDIVTDQRGEWANNYPKIFAAFENHFGIQISEEQKQEIISKTNIKHNKKISDRLGHFSRTDKETKLHGLHVNTGGTEIWKNHVIPALQSHYQNSILAQKWDKWLKLNQ